MHGETTLVCARGVAPREKSGKPSDHVVSLRCARSTVSRQVSMSLSPTISRWQHFKRICSLACWSRPGFLTTTQTEQQRVSDGRRLCARRRVCAPQQAIRRGGQATIDCVDLCPRFVGPLFQQDLSHAVGHCGTARMADCGHRDDDYRGTSRNDVSVPASLCDRDIVLWPREGRHGPLSLPTSYDSRLTNVLGGG